MPATVLSQSSTRTVPQVATQKLRATAAPPKARRVVRRRGRARGELDSDDEIEREAATDSDSDDDDLSSLDSATDDSDTEPVSEDVIPHDRAHLPTPRNSKSPETVVKEGDSSLNEDVPSFFAPAGDWSEMVADEKANGPADLPVIDFTDFNGHPVTQNGPTRKPKKVKAKRPADSHATPVADSTQAPEAPVLEPPPNRPESQLNRTSPQSVRQAYQHKLETDPSFVPTIGNFWGHDDRLIDTELRSLSGWWRGRGRGRGRGSGMRGRGAFHGPDSRVGQAGEDATGPKPEDLPPIERAWTHDGFEELKRREEHRRADHLPARNGQPSPSRGALGGARGGFVAGRGRGGFARGNFASPTRPRNASPFSTPTRVRFVMKPELMWTKQHEAFLYFDTTLKPRAGQGPAFRVKIPGHESGLVRAPFSPRVPPQASSSKSGNDGSEAGDKHFVVRLPKRAGKEREVVVNLEIKENPIQQTAKAQVVASNPIPVPEQVQSSSVLAEPVTPAQSTAEVHIDVSPEPNIRSQLEQLSLEPQASDPARQAKTEEAVMRNPTTDVAPETQAADVSSALDRPALPPLQTTFTPPPPPPPPAQPISQRSPVYGSPYPYPQLPLGVALNQHGMPYEVATGHPVYLQPMYNPRPIIPSHFSPGMAFVPGHMHHHSAASPDFLAQPSSHTPPINGFIDPATGTPIFSFPRQTSRIEIRAPTEESGKIKTTIPRTSSSLRTTAPTFQPSRAVTNLDGGYYQLSSASEGAGPSYEHPAPMEDLNQPGMATMVAYPYQQPYYYPEPYGYHQYVDMSQTAQYDMYNMDQAPQGTVYY